MLDDESAGEAEGASDAAVVPSGPAAVPIELTAESPLETPYEKRDGKVIEGKDGWLFLANDRNRVLDQHAGDRVFQRPTLRRWQLVLENRTGWATGLGSRYVFVVPPNAHAVFPEHLPDSVPSAQRRPVHQLMQTLASSDSFAKVLYPVERMHRNKQDLLPYTPTDSHWTAFGAFLAYEEIADELGDALPRRIAREDVLFSETEVLGDLGKKVDPVRRGPTVTSVLREPKARITGDNRVRNTGRIIRYVCPAAPKSCCVVFGDSFCYALLRYLAESFRRLVFVHFPTFDHDIVREVRPNVVITSLNERFLLAVPDDWQPETARAVALRRLDAGDVLSPATIRALTVKLNWP
ncbi:MAG: hypothetical protein WKF94_08935 [Solirubrobacteraceae bacterium]